MRIESQSRVGSAGRRRVGGIARAALAAALALGADGCSRREKAREKPPTPVQARVVETLAAGQGIRFSAGIRPAVEVDLAFKSGGYVRELLEVPGVDGRKRPVQEGDWVAKGAVLARVREDEYRDRAVQAKAQLDESEADLDRARLDAARAERLHGEKSLTAPDRDAARARLAGLEARFAGARAALAEAAAALRDCALRAPFAGLVLQRAVEVGTLAGPSQPAFSLADTTSVKVVFGVPDTLVASVPLGHQVDVVAEAVPNSVFHGQLTAVSAQADPASRVFEVEVTIPNPGGKLRAGMIASLSMADGGGQAASLPATPVVPLNAVVRSKQRPGGYAVFVVEGADAGAVARERAVTLGEVAGNSIAVAEGLRAGERVVVTGATLILDGERVSIVP